MISSIKISRKVLHATLAFIILFLISLSSAFLILEVSIRKPDMDKTVYVHNGRPNLLDPSANINPNEIQYTAPVPSEFYEPTQSPTPSVINTPSLTTTPGITSQPGSLQILMYHYIGDYYDPNKNDSNNTLMHGLAVPTAQFDQQMKFLSEKGYTTLDFDTLHTLAAANKAAPKNTVMLTFDDGYADFYGNAFPILKKYNMHATVYIITGFVGNSGYLSWDNIKELQQSGLVTIGSHTQHHKYLSSLPLPDLEKEVTQSKAELEQHLGTPIKDFCYPYGNFNTNVINAVSRAGYRESVTTAPGKWNASENQLLIPRSRISGYTTLDVFKKLF